MFDGSEEGSVTRAVPLPGHVMPVGADALTEQGFRDWVGSVHPVFAQMRLADILGNASCLTMKAASFDGSSGGSFRELLELVVLQPVGSQRPSPRLTPPAPHWRPPWAACPRTP